MHVFNKWSSALIPAFNIFTLAHEQDVCNNVRALLFVSILVMAKLTPKVRWWKRVGTTCICQHLACGISSKYSYNCAATDVLIAMVKPRF